MNEPIEKRSEAARFAKKQAAKTLGLQPFLDAKTRPRTDDVQGLIRQKMATELLRYEKKSFLVTALLWVTTGMLGGHRFYLERIGSGAAMALTGGGFFIWWLIDGLRLPQLVNRFNRMQAQREQQGLPPIGLEFLPSTRLEDLTRQPEWRHDAQLKMKSSRALAADLGLLAFLGVALAAITQSMGMLEPLVSAVMIILVFVCFDLFLRYAHLPLIHELLHVEFKLRLFYTHHRPGNALKLFFRPFFGLFTAPFDRQARQEIKLYLEVAGVFAMFLLVIKLLKTISAGGFTGFSLTAWSVDLIKMFLIIYMVTSPIGAVMTKHVLMGAKKTRIILLGTVALAAIALQLML